MKTFLPALFLLTAGLLQPALSNEAAKIRPSAFTATCGDPEQPLQLLGKCAKDHLVAFSITAFGKHHTLSDEQMAGLGAITGLPEIVVGRTKSGNTWYRMTFNSLRGNQPVAHVTVEDSVDELQFEKIQEPTPEAAPPKVIPKDGFIPDENTAVKVAEAILTPIEGSAVVQSYVPYQAKLKGDVWIIQGTTKGPGGTPVLEISKSNGGILRLYRTQ